MPFPGGVNALDISRCVLGPGEPGTPCRDLPSSLAKSPAMDIESRQSLSQCSSAPGRHDADRRVGTEQLEEIRTAGPVARDHVAPCCESLSEHHAETILTAGQDQDIRLMIPRREIALRHWSKRANPGRRTDGPRIGGADMRDVEMSELIGNLLEEISAFLPAPVSREENTKRAGPLRTEAPRELPEVDPERIHRHLACRKTSFHKGHQHVSRWHGDPIDQGVFLQLPLGDREVRIQTEEFGLCDDVLTGPLQESDGTESTASRPNRRQAHTRHADQHITRTQAKGSGMSDGRSHEVVGWKPQPEARAQTIRGVSKSRAPPKPDRTTRIQATSRDVCRGEEGVERNVMTEYPQLACQIEHVKTSAGHDRDSQRLLRAGGGHVRSGIQDLSSGLSTRKGPIARQSIFVRAKQSMAWAGVWTIGSFSLNDVFNTTGMPVTPSKALMSR